MLASGDKLRDVIYNFYYKIQIVNMKQVVIVMMGMMILFSCTPKKYGAFTVDGKVKNAPLPLMYLEQMPFTNNGTMVVLDSIKLSSSGNYELHGTGIEEGLFALTFNHQPAIMFVNDNGHITINYDIDNFRHPDVSGSNGTKDLYTFINNFRAKDSVLAYTYYLIDSIHQVTGSDSLAKPLQVQGEQQVGALNDVIKNFIQQSPNPANVFFALDKAKNTIAPQELNKLAITAAEKFKEHSGLAIFKSMMAQYLASANGSSGGAYALLNQAAPELTMNDVNEKPISISSFKGKYLLVDFWASWCAPCRRESPNIVAVYNKYKDKNFTILGVSLDDDKDAWLAAIKKDGLTWNQMSDLKNWESAATEAYQFNEIPFNVLIDPQGKIIASHLLGSELENKLAEVLK